MGDVAIRVDQLSKRYRIGKRQAGRTLREVLSDKVSSAFRRQVEASDGTSFWALRDVSFEVERGQVLGIIGRNGAGKSTLLKILSRITEPTTGEAEVFGRVGSLLEVGTGFHPELTGRENVFLNGAILGMKRREIDRHFDEIVQFAEVERFIDTAVKHYSSGMYVRLAFAVAAHFEPEVLIVDEVLAVGDASFQRKCLGTLGALAGTGRTVVLVTHNLIEMQRLASTAILVENGEIAASGPADAVVETYMNTGSLSENWTGVIELSERVNSCGGSALITRVELIDGTGKTTGCLSAGDSPRIVVDVKDIFINSEVGVGIYLKSPLGQRIAGITTFASDLMVDARGSTRSITFDIENLCLVPGRYIVEVVVAQKGVRRLDIVENVAFIEVVETDVFGTGETVNSGYGYVFLRGNWSESSPTVIRES